MSPANIEKLVTVPDLGTDCTLYVRLDEALPDTEAYAEVRVYLYTFRYLDPGPDLRTLDYLRLWVVTESLLRFSREGRYLREHLRKHLNLN